MTNPQGAPETSRLDPDPVPRRDFLGLASVWAMAAAGAFALLGAMRLPRAAVIPAPSKRFRVELPEGLTPGQPYFPAGRNVALFRERDGVYAISRICTHLGCVVKEKPGGFTCPCHGSQFAADGAVEKGPAPSALPWLAVKPDDGSWIVDEETTVPVGTKVV